MSPFALSVEIVSDVRDREKGKKMNNYFHGFEPDFEVKKELLFIGNTLELRQFDKIFISVSGGKDSHAMLFHVAELAESQGVSKNNLVVLYADTGMEWHNAEEQVRKLASAVGIGLEIVYPVRPMIEKIKTRMDRIHEFRENVNSSVFPNIKCRYCTSEQKVAPLDKFTIKFTGKLLKVTGERWAESKARSNYAEFVKLDRLTLKNGSRQVYGWRPMLAWSEADIWAKVKETGVERHQAYELGCCRLGCAGCIFSSDRELKIEMRENPRIFEALDRLEIESGFTMSMSKKRIRDRIK